MIKKAIHGISALIVGIPVVVVYLVSAFLGLLWGVATTGWWVGDKYGLDWIDHGVRGIDGPVIPRDEDAA